MRTLNTEVRRVLLALAEKFERQAAKAREADYTAAAIAYDYAANEVRSALEELEEYL